MKKRMAVLLALMIGFSYCPSGAVVTAAGNEGKIVETEDGEGNIEKTDQTEKKEENPAQNEKSDEDTLETKNSLLQNLLGIFLNEKEEEELSDDSSQKAQKTANKKSADMESSGLKNLQIPQKLDVVIDPWEIDEKGQVYSEQYIISNTGEAPGLLTLSNLTCRPRKQSGVVVRTDKEGLHDSGDKSIYMEMLFGNGEQIIFSQENSRYQTELMPGEELSICFAGEVNENAFGKWESNDIAVSVVYSWETGEGLDDAAARDSEEKLQDDEDIEETKEEAQSDTNKEESGEKTTTSLDLDELEEEPKADTEKGKSEEQQTEVGTVGLEKEPSDEANAGTVQETLSDTTAGEIIQSETFNTNGDSSLESSLGESVEGTAESQSSESNPDSDDKEKEEKIKNIDLQEPQKVDVVIDSWKVDEEGRIVSSQYLLQNIGNTAGVWTLSELACKPQEQSGVVIKADKNGLHDSEEKAVYMELVLGNGKKIALSQEKTEYKVELKPGEKLSVCFVGEMNGNLFETWEEGDITVTAVCTWNTKETVTE